jgi:ferredoxin
MKVSVDIEEEECLGYGDCVELAPGAFELDGVARLVGRAPVDELIDAARACPSAAIRLIDAESGEQIAP